MQGTARVLHQAGCRKKLETNGKLINFMNGLKQREGSSTERYKTPEQCQQ